jgi:hypothetical protein
MGGSADVEDVSLLYKDRALILDDAVEELKRMMESTVLFQFKKTRNYDLAVGYLCIGSV